MSTHRDRLAEGRRLRAAADHEQRTVDPSKPWPATADWFIWTRNNAGFLLDLLDDQGTGSRDS